MDMAKKVIFFALAILSLTVTTVYFTNFAKLDLCHIRRCELFTSTGTSENVKNTDFDDKLVPRVLVSETKIHKDNKVSRYYKLKTIQTKYEDKFVIYNPEFCSALDVIIIVPITASNVKARDTIRNTYGTMSRDRTYGIGGVKNELMVRALFVYGQTKSADDQQLINKEHDLYKDVLLIDFVDSYYNLTRKMINSFRWIDTFCTNISYVIKADDDVFINIPLLLTKVKELSVKSRDSVFGSLIGKGKVRRSGKWLISRHSYPFSNYPAYLSGTSYVIPGHLLARIVYYAQYFPYVNIEDAFIIGIICNNVLGANVENLVLHSRYRDLKPDACQFVATDRLAQSSVDPETMLSIWNALLDYDKQCKRS